VINRTLARRYAQAAFGVAAERNAADRVGRDLERIAAELDANQDAKRFFLAPIVSRYEKERILGEAFQGRIDDVALHTLLLLVRKHREPLLDAVLEEYRTLEMNARGLEPVTVASARPLSAQALAKLMQRLQALYGKQFEAHTVVDPSLIGGLRVTMGDRRVDGTIARRLDDLARTLDVTL
jgi:F-type H+-transporting ATPase subunit delta